MGQKKFSQIASAEREIISRGLSQDKSFAAIARELERPTSAVSREAKTSGHTRETYRVIDADFRSDCRKEKPKKPKKIDTNTPLRNYVYEKLKNEWSPEEIAERIVIDYPLNMTMRISHETIYTHLYCLPRGELKKELMKGLRREQKERKRRGGTYEKRGKIEGMISITERPAEAEGRTVPGHWEGDLVMGKGNKTAIGTLVERTTRTTIIVPLKEKDAVSVRKAFEKEMASLPSQMKLSLTYDRGKEMSDHKNFTKNTEIQVYFADPYSPWQRGTNENTNGLIRQYFPKGTDFSTVSRKEIKRVQDRLNGRPRKVLGYYTPYEVSKKLLG